MANIRPATYNSVSSEDMMAILRQEEEIRKRVADEKRTQASARVLGAEAWKVLDQKFKHEEVPGPFMIGLVKQLGLSDEEAIKFVKTQYKDTNHTIAPADMKLFKEKMIKDAIAAEAKVVAEAEAEKNRANERVKNLTNKMRTRQANIIKTDPKKSQQSSTSQKSSTAEKCKGTNQNGDKCGRTTTDITGYCPTHRNKFKTGRGKSKTRKRQKDKNKK